MLNEKILSYVKKYRKTKYIWCIIALVSAFLCFGLYLFPHYSADTYRIVRLKDLSINQTWNDFTVMYIKNGRYSLGILMFLVRLIGFNPLPTGIIANLLSIILLAINIIYAYFLISPYLIDKVRTTSFVAISVIFLSPCFTDWFQFAECTPYYLFGVLLCLIGVKLLFNNSKLSGLGLLFVAIGIYQPILSFFVFFYMLILVLQLVQDVEKEECNIIKKYIIGVVLGIAVYALLSGTQLLIIRTLGTSARVNLDIISNVITVIKTQPRLWNMEMIGDKSYLFVIMFFIAMILCIMEIILLSKKNQRYIMCGICIVVSFFGVYASVFVSHIFAEAWLSQRTVVMFYALFSFIVLIDLKLFSYKFNKSKVLILLISSLILSMIFIYRTTDIAIGLIKTNTQDKQIALLIDEKIKEYEEDTGIKVINIAFIEDQNITWGYPDIFYLYDLNVRAWAVSWTRNNLFYQYTGRNLNEVEVSQEIYKLRYEGKDWMNYSEEQLCFDGDTLYVGIY